MKRRHAFVPKVNKIKGFGRISAFPWENLSVEKSKSRKNINFHGAACIWRPLPWRIAHAVFHKCAGRRF